MSRPSLYWPIKPAKVIQAFGADPAYYKAFNQKGHPGNDYETIPAHGQPVYAAHDGEAIYIKDQYGGEGVWNYADGYITISWHMIGDTDPAFMPPIPYNNKGIRTQVKAGDLIGYANNTGAPKESTGPHFHFGLLITLANGQVANPNNGYDGCIDPAPYMNGKYAQDIPTLNILYTKLIGVLTNLVNALKGSK